MYVLLYVLAGLWNFDVLFDKPFRSYALVMLKIQPFLSFLFLFRFEKSDASLCSTGLL